MRRPARRANPHPARREPESASPGRNGRRRFRTGPALTSTSGLDECTHLVVILDPWRLFELRRSVDGPGPNCPHRFADVFGPEPPGEHDAPLGDGGALEVEWILLVPGEVDDLRDGLAVPQENRVAAANPALLPFVELDEVGPGFFRLADEYGDAEAVVRDGQDLPRTAWALLGEDEPEHVRACLDGCVDIFATRETADLHERAREDFTETGRRILGAHQGRADEDRIGARELGGRALCARVHTALCDDHR